LGTGTRTDVEQHQDGQQMNEAACHLERGYIIGHADLKRTR
jgi:hypothetical protein